MDMSQLEAISKFQFKSKDSTHPVIFYGSYELLDSMDDKVREQITNVAQLPGLVGAAMTMPDAHWGYGFPIGGVAAYDAEAGGIISAGGVGFDISCGVRALRTNYFVTDILSVIEKMADALFRTVPAGVGAGGGLTLSTKELDKVMLGGAQWAVQQGYGDTADLEFIEEHGAINGAHPQYVSAQAKKRQLNEMGTLGSGNHYLEIEVVDKIYDEQAATVLGIAEGQIVIAIHCGSRGLGHQIGSDYLVSLAKVASQLGVVLPDRELACAPILSEPGQHYLGAMNAGINIALANRQIITHLTREALSRILPQIEITTLYDVSHNTCKREQHVVNGTLRELYIHRKGATRAFPPHHPALPQKYAEIGQPVFIGGSMGTGSYLLAGNPATQNKAFASACHGAGRRMSRRQALKQWRGRELIDQLAERGIYIRTNSLRGVAEEAPGAYKDVDEVVMATDGAGLARRVAFLRPLACVKG